jgi:sterol desaturase/sphingolipid hydroxylase (fatty acid hydroxylase superfamily)
LGIPVVALVFGLEILISKLRRDPIYSFSETISNLSAGLGTLLIGVFLGPLLLAGWDFAHSFSPIPWAPDAWWRWPLALIFADLCYYLWHRAGHQFGFLWAIHGVHHQHEQLNSTVGLRLEWFADPFAGLFFLAMPLLGCDSLAGYAMIAVLSLYTLTTHSPILNRWNLGLFVSGASHGAHHSRDLRFAGKNFGAMLTIWDRLFGTYQAPVPRAELKRDVATVSRCHDSVASQWVLLGELWGDLRRAASLRERFALLFGPPRLREHAGAKSDAEVQAGLGARGEAYVLASFLWSLAAGTWLLWSRDERHWLALCLGAALVLWSFRTQGGLLDGRPRALWGERIRWALTLALCLVLAGRAPWASLALGSSAAVLLGLSWVPSREAPCPDAGSSAATTLVSGGD